MWPIVLGEPLLPLTFTPVDGAPAQTAIEKDSPLEKLRGVSAGELPNGAL